MTDAEKRAQKVRMIIFDVDGVLTDGGIYVGAEGELYKPFNCRDGLGIALWQRAGFKTAVITGRDSAMVANRVAELHITALWQNCPDKRDAYAELKARYGLADEEIAYVGDDLIDLPILVQVGLAAAVGDAAPEVRAQVHITTVHTGGHGAAREVIEFILKAQGRWDGIVAGFLQ